MTNFVEVWVFTKEDFQRFLGAVTGEKINKEKLGRMLHLDEVASEYRTRAYMKEGSTVVDEQSPSPDP